MNTYEEKQERKRNYYEMMAMKAQKESDELAEKSFSMSDRIPFGQPIINDTDRRFRKRIGDTMTKSVMAGKKAEYYAAKAESVGTGGISGFDPDAVKKLEEKLEKLETLQEKMKAANRAIRLKDVEKGNKKLMELGFSESTITKLRTPDFCGRVGFPGYELTNNNANIRRIKERIEELKKLQTIEENTETESNSLYEYFLDDGRIQFSFDGKPSEKIRNILKSHSFKWSPFRKTWVRQITPRGLYAAKQVREELKEFIEE